MHLVQRCASSLDTLGAIAPKLGRSRDPTCTCSRQGLEDGHMYDRGRFYVLSLVDCVLCFVQCYKAHLLLICTVLMLHLDG